MKQEHKRFRTDVDYSGDHRYTLILHDEQEELSGEYHFYQTPLTNRPKVRLRKALPTLYDGLKETA